VTAAKSVRKKMQQKSFAANVSRDDIVRGAEDLAVELNEHIQFVIEAMAGIADDIGLGGAANKEDYAG
jgi:predicted hydrolase (HD superfamily)